MNNTGATFQVRVGEYQEGLSWYETLFQRAPDFVPHEDFAEWEIIKGTWLQVSQGNPTIGNGPLRLGVSNIAGERKRIMEQLHINIEPINKREGVPAAWCTFTDPYGNKIGLYQDL
ncbi:VOC family protein [Pontibacillus salicampi]|uniref:VOC family protein n=1 Tax=Pontibacillus salicampi TaxID=1449801 RepID=A0ABV6LQ19_9BACI